MIEAVAIELELETQPFLISSAAMGATPLASRNMSNDTPNFTTVLGSEGTGRRDR